ncbi:BBM_1a_G0016420.mRNA.1.CDS.1 [Saccharomyces cerevisiae]|nr:BBM_1a_G0016420.mRNA.1.CDS.1 [Saccharomyces cerevisiae]CAI7106342.1 BBM_1a_G0016420.mRNA.1.CDS.1 [Saccharomyces cerevisiae]
MVVSNLKSETVDIEKTAKKDEKPLFALNVEAINISENPDVSRYDSHTGVKRALKNRHISLLALAVILALVVLLVQETHLTKAGRLLYS